MVSGSTIIVLATVSKGFSKTDHAAQLILLLAEVAVEDFPTASPIKILIFILYFIREYQVGVPA